MILKKKICMIGSYAVGKTSLVRRFVKGIFSDHYLTTVGVKIDKKTIIIDSWTVDLLLWDLEGNGTLSSVKSTYLKNAAGYFLVADGAREATFTDALSLQKEVEALLGKVPFVLLLNKYDLTNQWSISPETIAELKTQGWSVLYTSAKDGLGVEEAFTLLTQKLLEV